MYQRSPRNFVILFFFFSVLFTAVSDVAEPFEHLGFDISYVFFFHHSLAYQA